MKKVAVFLANGFEEIEALATVDILRRAGIPVQTVSITDDLMVLGAHNITVLADTLYNNIDFSELDVLVLPGGGVGAENLNKHEKLKKHLSKFVSENKQVAAICAAPAVLGGLGLLKDKEATCYPGFESKLTGAITSGKKVVVSDNITTGKGPGLVFDFALQLVENIAGVESRNKVAEGLLLRE